MSTLAVMPTYIREQADLDVTITCLESLRTTQPELELLVVDDGSPAVELVVELRAAVSRLDFEINAKPQNEGFSRTVNVGLRRALHEGKDAVLINADMQFLDTHWLEVMEQTVDEKGIPASVVGAKLLYPTGLIQHGGIFFSLLHRAFEHKYKYAPHDLPEANKACRCPVTGALQFIRLECLRTVGIYDEEFRLGWEDVDYCIRTWQSGRSTVYQPGARAIHHESMFRGRPSPKVEDWTQRSWIHFCQKHRDTSFAEFITPLI